MSDLPIVRRDSSAPAIFEDIKRQIGPAVSAIDELDYNKLPTDVAVDLDNLKNSIVSLKKSIEIAESLVPLFKITHENSSFYEKNYWYIFAVFVMIALFIFVPMIFTSILQEKTSGLTGIYLISIIFFGAPLSLFLSRKLSDVNKRREEKKQLELKKLEAVVNQKYIDEVIEKSQKLKNIDTKIPDFRSS
ncbi:UNVERIFIED_ORG: hypothetical protein M2438_005405 [Methylobacterium sp. SuP10 SLI 274]|uniref:hypothetical protein n=1 Tax=Methylorubrum extorquens TaxID=408 RepID=UPI0020A0855E|nr:hypothetical protein [Methylorubrum extorquens]MDF9866395.1 hypothetical protein [Methylorubrum pseudosasae]MDH6640159.1 hypothetical protein [Methylobacterium sp. SuP10 SLI 274]MDH6669332.1 hypothetical protein [Methylorubrum zatmanii]MCP1561890.1 hypothetical protein [Methylorubrum extorquens]MDF9794704.1 hypothetical protein [Methylorubrum extorquens]